MLREEPLKLENELEPCDEEEREDHAHESLLGNFPVHPHAHPYAERHEREENGAGDQRLARNERARGKNGKMDLRPIDAEEGHLEPVHEGEDKHVGGNIDFLGQALRDEEHAHHRAGAVRER